MTWGLCAALRFLVGEEFADIPLFQISITGIISGIIMGITTVLIAAEACTYASCGCVVGCAVGLFISKFLYDTLITAHFSYAIWHIPFLPLAVILLFVWMAAIGAVHAPSKRIRSHSIAKTFGEW